MKPTTKIVLFLIILTTGIVLGRMLRSPSQSPLPSKTSMRENQYETQNNEGGNVTVSVTPLFLKPGLPASFDVAFETHSVDLTFDIVKIATLTDETETSYTPFWDGSPPGGHHRKGTLRFTPDLSTPQAVTLSFSDIAGVPSRTFTWEAKQ